MCVSVYLYPDPEPYAPPSPAGAEQSEPLYTCLYIHISISTPNPETYAHPSPAGAEQSEPLPLRLHGPLAQRVPRPRPLLHRLRNGRPAAARAAGPRRSQGHGGRVAGAALSDDDWRECAGSDGCGGVFTRVGVCGVGDHGAGLPDCCLRGTAPALPITSAGAQELSWGRKVYICTYIYIYMYI